MVLGWGGSALGKQIWNPMHGRVVGNGWEWSKFLRAYYWEHSIGCIGGVGGKSIGEGCPSTWGCCSVERQGEGLQENSRFWVCSNRYALVWAFLLLIEGNMDVHIQEIQVMQCMICHPMPSFASTLTFSPSPKDTRHKTIILTHFLLKFRSKTLVGLPLVACTPSFRIAQGFFLLVDPSCSWGYFSLCFVVVRRNRAWCHFWLNVWLV